MIIVGLESCPGCKLIHEKHPNIPYIELPRSGEVTKDMVTLRDIISKLNITEFPVILNDGLNRVLPLSILSKE